MNIKGASSNETWMEWQDKLDQEIITLWTRERTVKEIAFFLQLSQPYVMKAIQENQKKLDLKAQPIKEQFIFTWAHSFGPMVKRYDSAQDLLSFCAGWQGYRQHYDNAGTESHAPIVVISGHEVRG